MNRDLPSLDTMVILATVTYQKSSWSWQLQKLYQRAQEWVMLKLNHWNPDVPDVPDWSFAPQWLEVLFWILVVVVVGLFAWQLYGLFTRYWPTEFRDTLMGRSRSETTTGPPPTIATWLKSAQSFQQQGNYPEACRALYMAMIVRLNETQLIPDDRSRTDGEYDALVTQLPQSEHYQTLLQTHEELQFGNVILSAERFQRCQRAYTAIEQGLNP